MFSVRIVKVDHYMAPPIRGLDVCYSEFRNCQLNEVPIIRIFGPTPAGQKVCIHLHGTFPYIYIPYDGSESVDRYMYQLAVRLDQALTTNHTGTDSGGVHWVHKVELVSGTPFYGYHAKEHQFLKIYFLNPKIIERAVDLLQSGAIMNHPFQPHEAHIPYILQVFIDYNLYGMNLIKFQSIKFRRKSTAYNNMPIKRSLDFPESCHVFNNSTDSANGSFKRWDPDDLPSAFASDDSILKQSTCELEVDALGVDVINALDFAGSDMNPGIAAIWEDERQRRRQMNKLSQITPPSSQDRQPAMSTRSETEYLEKVKQKLCLVTGSQEMALILDESQVHGNSGVEANSQQDSGQTLNLQSQKRVNENSLQGASGTGCSQTSDKDTVLDDNDFMELLLELMERESVNLEPNSHSRSPSPPHHGLKVDDEKDEITMSQIVLDDDLEEAPSDTVNSPIVCDNPRLPLNDNIPQLDGPNDPKDACEGSANTVHSAKASSMKIRSSPRKILEKARGILSCGNSEPIVTEKKLVRKEAKSRFLSSSSPSTVEKVDLLLSPAELSNSVLASIPKLDSQSSAEGLNSEAIFNDGLGSTMDTGCDAVENTVSEELAVRKPLCLSLRSRGKLQPMCVKNKEPMKSFPIKKSMQQITKGKLCSVESNNSVVRDSDSCGEEKAINTSPLHSMQTRTSRKNASATSEHHLSEMNRLVVAKEKSACALQQRTSHLSLRSGKKLSAQCKALDSASSIASVDNEEESPVKDNDFTVNAPEDFSKKQPDVCDIEESFCESLKSNVQTKSYPRRRSRGKHRGGGYDRLGLKNDVPEQDQSKCDQPSEQLEVICTASAMSLTETRYGGRRGRARSRTANHEHEQHSVEAVQETPNKPEFIEKDTGSLNQSTHSEDMSTGIEEVPEQVMPSNLEFTVTRSPLRTGWLSTRQRSRGQSRGRGSYKNATCNITAKNGDIPKLTEPPSIPEIPVLTKSTQITELETPVLMKVSNLTEPPTLKEMPKVIKTSDQNKSSRQKEMLEETTLGSEIPVILPGKRVGQLQNAKLRQKVERNLWRQVCIRDVKIMVDSSIGLQELIQLGFESIKIKRCQFPLNTPNKKVSNEIESLGLMSNSTIDLTVANYNITENIVGRLEGIETELVLALPTKAPEDLHIPTNKASDDHQLHTDNAPIDLHPPRDKASDDHQLHTDNAPIDLHPPRDKASEDLQSFRDRTSEDSSLQKNKQLEDGHQLEIKASVGEHQHKDTTSEDLHQPNQNAETDAIYSETKLVSESPVVDVGCDVIVEDEKAVLTDDTEIYELTPSPRTIILRVSKVAKDKLGDINHLGPNDNNGVNELWECKLVGHTEKKNINSGDDSDESVRFTPKERKYHAIIDSNYEEESQTEFSSTESEPKKLPKSKRKWRHVVSDSCSRSESNGSWNSKRVKSKSRGKTKQRRRIVVCSETEDEEEKETYPGRPTSKRGARQHCNEYYSDNKKLDQFVVDSSESESSSIKVSRRGRRLRSCRKIVDYDDSDDEYQDVCDEAFAAFGRKNYSLRNNLDKIHDVIVEMRPTNRRTGVDYGPNAYASFYDPEATGVDGWTSTQKAGRLNDLIYKDEPKDFVKLKVKGSALNPFVRLERLNEETIEKYVQGQLPFSTQSQASDTSEEPASASETQDSYSRPPSMARASSNSDDDDDVGLISPRQVIDHADNEGLKDANLELLPTDKPSSAARVELGESPTADRFSFRADEPSKKTQILNAPLDDEERYAPCEDALYKLSWLSPIPEKEKTVVRPPLLTLLRTRSPTEKLDMDVTLGIIPSAAQPTQSGNAPKQSSGKLQHDNPPLHGSLPGNTQQPTDPGCAAQNTQLLVHQGFPQNHDRQVYSSSQNVQKYSFPQCNATPSSQERYQYPGEQVSHAGRHAYSYNLNILESRHIPTHSSTQSGSSYMDGSTLPNSRQHISHSSMPPPSLSGPVSTLNMNTLQRPQFPEFRMPNEQDRCLQPLPHYHKNSSHASNQNLQNSCHSNASPLHHCSMPVPSPQGPRFAEISTPNSQQCLQSAVMPSAPLSQGTPSLGYSIPNSQEWVQSANMSSIQSSQRSNFTEYPTLSSQELLRSALMPPPPSPRGPYSAGYSTPSSQERLQSAVMPSIQSPLRSNFAECSTPNFQERLQSAMMPPSSSPGHIYSNSEMMQRTRYPGYMPTNSQGQIYHRGIPLTSPRGPAYPWSLDARQRPRFQGCAASNVQFQRAPSTSFPQMQLPARPAIDSHPQLLQRSQGGFQFQQLQASVPSHSSNAGPPTDTSIYVKNINTLVSQTIKFYLNESPKQTRFPTASAAHVPQVPPNQYNVMPNYYVDKSMQAPPFTQSVVPLSQNSTYNCRWSGSQMQGSQRDAFSNLHMAEAHLQTTPLQPPPPQPIRSVHEIRNSMCSLGLDRMSNPSLQTLLDKNPVYTAFHPSQNVRIVKRRGPRRTQAAKLNRKMCTAGRILMPEIVFKSCGFTVRLTVRSGRSVYPPIIKPLDVRPKSKRGKPRLNRLRSKVLQSAYPYNVVSKIRGRQRSHCKSSLAAHKAAKPQENVLPPKVPSGPPKSMPILNSSDKPLVNVFDTPTPSTAFPPERKQTARRSIGIRRGMASTRGSFPTASPSTTLPPPSIRGTLPRGLRRGRGRPPLSLRGNPTKRNDDLIEALKVLQNQKPKNAEVNRMVAKRGPGRPPLQKNLPRETSAMESLMFITEKRPEDIADKIPLDKALENSDDEINLDLSPLEEIEPEWFEQPSTLFGKPMQSTKIAAMQASKPEEKDGSNLHEEKDESGLHEEKDESGWHEEKDESGGHEEKDESGWHEEKDESGLHEEKDESGWHEEKDESGWQEEKDESGWHEENDESGWHEKKDESGCHEKKDESGSHEEKDESGWHEENDPSSRNKKKNTPACPEKSSLDSSLSIATLPEKPSNNPVATVPTTSSRIPYRFRKKPIVPAPSFEDVELAHLKSDVLNKFKRDFKRVMGERPTLADDEILSSLLGADIKTLSGTQVNAKSADEATDGVADDGNCASHSAESGQSANVNGRDSPFSSKFFSPMLSALQFDTTLDENSLFLPVVSSKRYSKDKVGMSSLTDCLDVNEQESPGKNTFNSYITLGSSPEPMDHLNKSDRVSKPSSSLFDSGMDNFDNYMPETPCGHNSPDMFDSWCEDVRPAQTFPDAMDFPVGSPAELTDISDSVVSKQSLESDQLPVRNSLSENPQDGLGYVAAIAEGINELVNMQKHSLGSSSTAEATTSKDSVGEMQPACDGAKQKEHLVTLEKVVEEFAAKKDDELTKADASIGEAVQALPTLNRTHIVPDLKTTDLTKEFSTPQENAVLNNKDHSLESDIKDPSNSIRLPDKTNDLSQEYTLEFHSDDAVANSFIKKTASDIVDNTSVRTCSSQDTLTEKAVSDSIDSATGVTLSNENTLAKKAVIAADVELTPVQSFYVYDKSEPTSMVMSTPKDVIKDHSIMENVSTSQLTVPKSKVLTYFILPPSPETILSSMPEHRIPETRHPVAHCSNVADVPTSAVQLGGGAVVLKLQSKSVSDLSEFDRSLCSTGLNHWCQVLKIAEEAGYACSNDCLKKLLYLGIPRLHQGLCLEFHPRPPRALQVEKWLDEKVAEIKRIEEIKNDCSKNSEKQDLEVKTSNITEGTAAKHPVEMTIFPTIEISPISCPVDYHACSMNGSNREICSPLVTSVVLNHGHKKRRLSFSIDQDQSKQSKDDLKLLSPTPISLECQVLTSPCSRRLKRSFSDGDSAAMDCSLEDLDISGSPSSTGPIVKKAKWTSSTPHKTTPSRQSCLKKRAFAQDLVKGSQEFSLRRQLFLQQMKTNVHPETSQLQGPTPKNTYGFKMSVETLQDTKSIHVYQHITLMSMELHVQTDDDLRPNPRNNAICAIFYHVYHDIPVNCNSNLKRQERLTGIIISEASTVNANNAFQKSASEDPLKNDESLTMQNPKNSFRKHAELTEAGVDVLFVQNEFILIQEFVKIVHEHDPDILLGYEIQMLSWGYLFERCAIIGIKLCPLLSRVPEDSMNIFHPPQEGIGDTFVLNIVGRIILNVWQILKSELALYNYTFENLAYHVLHKRIPLFSFRTLTLWYGQQNSLDRWRTLQHYIIRAKGNVQLLEQLNFIGKTSELARLFGIQFYEVLSRGTQFRVESMVLRLCRKKKFIAVSPSVQQRSAMRSPEYIPLILEPVSKFHTNPVVVLDFQSLYPSIIIAYNYCFSTCIGRIEDIGQSGAFQFGCTSLKIPSGLLMKLQNLLAVAPCGVAFVKSEIRKGILPRMLEEILSSRIMVKTTMKQHTDDKALYAMLDARQLGLKLISNVTYGYTAANFSGRMPCVEIADSVVSKGRETLERAISLIQNTLRWNAKVIYGDTDSVFVLLEGRSKEQAFAIGKEIAQAVTADNPKPVKLKLEKVYLPCVLETKKRYVGNMYETPDQVNPVFDAKGIETVRRDGCPAVAKILEKSIRILFATHDVSQVKIYVQNQFHKILMGRCGLIDYIFTREYHGRNGYRQENHAPAFKIARSLIQSDCRAEPRVGERVPYVVTYGSPGAILLDLICHPHEALLNSALRLNAKYYINTAICPALDRVFSLLGADVRQWYSTLPRSTRLPLPVENPSHEGGTILHHFTITKCPICDASVPSGICPSCLSNPQKSLIVLTDRIRQWERCYQQISMVCQACTGTTDQRISCVSLNCPIFFRLGQSSKDLAQAPYVRGLLKKASLNW